MNYRSGILILLAVAALCVVGVAGAHANELRAPNDFQQRVIDRTNMYRQQNGCAALTVNSKLTQAAQGHSDDMAYNDFFSHVGSNGSTFASRLQAAGYAYLSAAENIAAGYSTPESVVDAWFNESPPNDGHRQNILNCAFKDIGVGYTYLENDTGDTNYHYYWVQDFWSAEKWRRANTHANSNYAIRLRLQAQCAHAAFARAECDSERCYGAARLERCHLRR